ncbi:C2H2 finger domain transcription factor [Pyrenophora seminiperda CCB06]|uniref:C2H2 finger domain transcription factor n=1 Tax=Pyrenophora seminiperda CCB06 TaxID=1302712 RepID=A0A3M7MCA2_9PLEO|nr:C2H2 finger domain transcription factor [Pyrenophora seminiperda CCB06]
MKRRALGLANDVDCSVQSRTRHSRLHLLSSSSSSSFCSQSPQSPSPLAPPLTPVFPHLQDPPAPLALSLPGAASAAPALPPVPASAHKATVPKAPAISLLVLQRSRTVGSNLPAAVSCPESCFAMQVLDTVEYYGEEDAILGSPPLQAIIVKTTPSRTPSPRQTSPGRSQTTLQSAQTQPTQGDWVLLRQMDPNHPDIAQRASEVALNYSDSSPSDDEMLDVDSSNTAAVASDHNAVLSAMPNTHTAALQQTAQEALLSTPDPKATATHRDSVLEEDVIRHGSMLADRRPSQPSALHMGNGVRSNSLASNLNSVTSTLSNTSLQPPNQPFVGFGNGHTQENDLVTLGLRQLTIPQSRGVSMDTLPALQATSPARDRAAASPSQQLPSFSEIDELARSATSNHEATRSNSFPHRPSMSSVGHSPTSMVRQLSMSSHSPATPFPPISASSPMSANEAPHRGDLFLRTTGGGVFSTDARRPSQAASDTGHYPATLSSASTSESYQSSDGLSPGTQPTPIEQRPRHMSLDGALASRVLPPPLNSGLHGMHAHATGSFKCDYVGCTAAPFQTQYLLNSHTNVHSSNRPHYCPVKDCPRGEGGKGFKRKNEMIRHGLVHQSPGYVCPFCPDREHKYPRPDNLQRHVRVHHPDKDKDDPELRDVLAQRPEGGSRGRRRRVSDSGH